MTQRLAKPASSAVLPISASLGPIPPTPSGQVKLGICSPIRTTSLLSLPQRPTGRFYRPARERNEGVSGYRMPYNLEEALHVLLGVVDVWRDTHAVAAHAHEDALCGEPGGEVFGGDRAELEPDHVPRPALRRYCFDAEIPGL